MVCHTHRWLFSFLYTVISPWWMVLTYPWRGGSPFTHRWHSSAVAGGNSPPQDCPEGNSYVILGWRKRDSPNPKIPLSMWVGVWFVKPWLAETTVGKSIRGDQRVRGVGIHEQEPSSMNRGQEGIWWFSIAGLNLIYLHVNSINLNVVIY